MTSKPRQKKSLKDILDLNEPLDFCTKFYQYLIDKRINDKPLNEAEEVAFMLLRMESSIYINGFVDLFYQQYSLRECIIVEEFLKNLGLDKLASLFNEAKMIYIRGQEGITEQAYKDINPFEMGEEQGDRFNEIGEIVLAEGSELYLIPGRIYDYIKTNSGQYTP